MKFSILIPFKYGSKYASACFKSIESAFKSIDYEIIVILDNPSKKEIAGLEKAACLYKQKIEIKIMSSNGNGISDALNYGIHHSEAEYIVRHDIDDLCFTWRGERLLELIKLKPDFIFGSVVCFPIPIYLGCPKDKMHSINIARKQNPFFHPASSFKKSTIIKMGGYDNNFDRLEDFELWTRVLLGDYKIKFDTHPHTKYRKHAKQYTRLYSGEKVDKKRDNLKSKIKQIYIEGIDVKPKKSFAKGLYYLIIDFFK